jgi:dihydrofolate reductase
MSNYWQTAEQSSNSPLEKEFAKKINDMNKIVLSRSPIELTWKNSKHLSFTDNQRFIKLIRDLKNQKGKNISVESGIGMWKQFLQHNLFDELMFYIHPTIFGNGVRLFDEINSQTVLKLKCSKALDKGVVKLHYEKLN